MLLVFGPGLVVMFADTDAGSIVVAAQSGAQWGYHLLLLQFILMPILFIAQELSVRLGIVTGKGHGELIKKQFGSFWAWVSVSTLIVNPHRGTIVKQAFDSVVEMIGLAQEQGWAGVMIVDGHPDMQRAAWVEGCRVGMRIDGYTPDIEAEKQRRRIVSQSLDEMHAALKGLK